MAAVLTSPEILQAKRRRLDRLEVQAAQLGIGTPPEIANEIADLKTEIQAAQAPASEVERYELLLSLVQEVRRDVRQLYWLIPVLMLLLCGFLVLLVRL
jgi:hypothetical protein